MTGATIDVPEVDPAAAADKLARGALALDVREVGEWEAGRISGALHVPLGELGRRLSEIPRERQLVAVCRSGSRSAYVTKQLLLNGYDVENLAGGLEAWASAGLPLEPRDGFVA